jgi:cytoskeletal protein CcmA (bactofilin family)
MFNKQSQGGTTNEFETVIGPSVKVKGDFNSQGNIIVQGVVDGNLKTVGSLEVGEKARVTANIDAREAKIGGEVRGNIKVKGYLEITASAKIFGDVEAATLSIEHGAVFNGKCIMPTGIEDIKKISKDKGAIN